MIIGLMLLLVLSCMPATRSGTKAAKLAECFIEQNGMASAAATAENWILSTSTNRKGNYTMILLRISVEMN